MARFSLFNVILLASQFSIVSSVYFVQSKVFLTVSTFTSDLSPIHRAVALHEFEDNNLLHQNETLSKVFYSIGKGKVFSVTKQVNNNSNLKSSSSSSCPNLRIDSQLGHVYILYNVTTTANTNKDFNKSFMCKYVLSAASNLTSHTKKAKSILIVKFDLGQNASEHRSNDEEQGCFKVKTEQLNFQVEENLKSSVTVAYILVSNSTYKSSTSFSYHQVFASASPYFTIVSNNSSSGSNEYVSIQTTIHSLDRELISAFNFTISCTKMLATGNGTGVVKKEEIKGRLNVLDVNDNLPVLFNETLGYVTTNETRFINISMNNFLGKYKAGERVYPHEATELFIRDMDTVEVNSKYSIISYNDSLDLFNLTYKSFEISGSVMEAYYPTHTGIFLNLNFSENVDFITPWQEEEYCIRVGVQDRKELPPSVHFLICINWGGLAVDNQIRAKQIIQPNELRKRLVPFIGFAQVTKDAVSLSRILTPFPNILSDYTNAVANISFEISRIFVLNKRFASVEEEMDFVLTNFHNASYFSSSQSPSSSNPHLHDVVVTAPEQYSSLFGITPIMGQVYLKESSLLQSSFFMELNVFLVEIMCHSSIISSFKRNATIIFTTVNSTKCIKNYIMEEESLSVCAEHINKTTCESTCGYSAAQGKCEWAEYPHHSTCIPTTVKNLPYPFCPDNICDELEHLNPMLCPQDCNRMIGQNSTHQNLTAHAFFDPEKNQEQTTYHGISKCDGVISCKTPMICSCINLKEEIDLTTDSIVVTSPTPPLSPSPTWELKDSYLSWILTFAVVVAVTFVLLGLFLFLCVYTQKRRILLVTRARPNQQETQTGHQQVQDNENLQTAIESTSLQQDESLQESDELSLSCYSFFEICPDNITLSDTLLGMGNFGKVFKATLLLETTNENQQTINVALKTCIPTFGLKKKTIWDNVISEYNFMDGLSNHINVLKTFGIYISPDQQQQPFIVMEIASLGSLSGVLRKARKLHQTHLFGTSTRLDFAIQICNGMEYISSQNVVHRDVACRNILLTENLVCKITDFGMARYLTKGHEGNDDDVEYAYQLKNRSVKVPVKWTAIESLVHGKYTTLSDVWSFGIVLWEIESFAESPYPGWNSPMLYYDLEDGKRMEIPKNCSTKMYSIMLQCWQKNPQLRPSFSTIKTLLLEM